MEYTIAGMTREHIRQRGFNRLFKRISLFVQRQLVSLDDDLFIARALDILKNVSKKIAQHSRIELCLLSDLWLDFTLLYNETVDAKTGEVLSDERKDSISGRLHSL